MACLNEVLDSEGRSFYGVLGVRSLDDSKEIRKAWLRSVERWKEATEDPAAHPEFQLLRKTYKTLFDPALREQYDAQLRILGHQDGAEALKGRTSATPSSSSNVSSSTRATSAASSAPRSSSQTGSLSEQTGDVLKKAANLGDGKVAEYVTYAAVKAHELSGRMPLLGLLKGGEEAHIAAAGVPYVMERIGENLNPTEKKEESWFDAIAHDWQALRGDHEASKDQRLRKHGVGRKLDEAIDGLDSAVKSFMHPVSMSLELEVFEWCDSFPSENAEIMYEETKEAPAEEAPSTFFGMKLTGEKNPKWSLLQRAEERCKDAGYGGFVLSFGRVFMRARTRDELLENKKTGMLYANSTLYVLSRSAWQESVERRQTRSDHPAASSRLI